MTEKLFNPDYLLSLCKKHGLQPSKKYGQNYVTNPEVIEKMIKAAGGRYWSAYFGDLDAQKVKEAQSLGLKVLAWTVNDPAAMSRMLDWGVDGLITDRPDLARKVLEARGVRWR